MSNISGVYIKSKRQGGHFRAGLKHPEEETYYPMEELDADVLEKFLSDPALDVRLVDKDGKSNRPATKATKATKGKGSGK